MATSPKRQFTNHSDAPHHDTDNHGNHSKPIYKESSGLVPSVEEPGTPEESEQPKE